MNTTPSPSFVERASSLANLLTRPSVGQPTHATLFVRLAVGSVFVSSGIVKFLFVNQGAGRFAKIGFPHAEALSETYVAWVRTASGWQRLGPFAIDADGRSLLVAPVGPAEPIPLEIVVTKEPPTVTDAPRCPALLRWTAP